jgi:hypothetical protein
MSGNINKMFFNIDKLTDDIHIPLLFISKVSDYTFLFSSSVNYDLH